MKYILTFSKFTDTFRSVSEQGFQSVDLREWIYIVDGGSVEELQFLLKRWIEELVLKNNN